MYVVDMHCDTISALYREKENRQGLYGNSLQVDIQKLRKGQYLLQNFAAYVDLKNVESPYENCIGQISLLLKELEANKNAIGLVENYKDIQMNREIGKISAMLTIEEGQVTEGCTDKLEEFYQLGVRMMTFTWNYPNELGYPANNIIESNEKAYKGLTETGIIMLNKMEEIGIIPDIAHLSEEGFWDVCKYAKKPFVCSHGNARELCKHPRNLTDDMIVKIGESGGVIGVNYYGEFLEEHPVKDTCSSTVKRIADHILYILNKGGRNSVGLGSDFDGMNGEFELKDCSKMGLLADELKKRGVHESQIEDVFYRNVLNIYEELLK